MPFGASAAVLAFNWVAAALCHLLVKALYVGASNFYDDFTIIERARLASHTTQVVDRFFALLGWTTKEMPPFAPTAGCLGAVLDVTRAHLGEIEVGNKDERAADITNAIGSFLQCKVAKRRDLEKLRGRFLFARTLCFGRWASCAVRAMNAGLSLIRGDTAHTDRIAISLELRTALSLLADSIASAPRRFLRVCYSWPVVVFTDGSLEGRAGSALAGIGGVLLDPHTGSFSYFSAVVGAGLTHKLFENSGNPIASIELLGVACALLLWDALLVDRSLIMFVDNEATKCCLVKGYSPQVDMMSICSLCTRAEIEQGSVLYFERVPSASNIGDGPSRFRLPPPLPQWGAATRTRLDDKAISWSTWGVAFSRGIRDAPFCVVE